MVTLHTVVVVGCVDVMVGSGGAFIVWNFSFGPVGLGKR